jgi:hypothetical protein
MRTEGRIFMAKLIATFQKFGKGPKQKVMVNVPFNPVIATSSRTGTETPR